MTLRQFSHVMNSRRSLGPPLTIRPARGLDCLVASQGTGSRVGNLLTAEASPANVTTSTRAVGVVATMMWHAPSRPCSDCFRDARMDEVVTRWFDHHFVPSLRASHV